MKILCFIDYLCSGGAQRQLVNMSVEFKKRGKNVHFLVYYEHNFYEETLIQNNIPLHFIDSQNSIDRVLKIRKFIRNSDFDVIISFLETPSFIASLCAIPYKKWKFIIGERNANPNILKNKKLIFYRWFHLIGDHIVANSSKNLDIVKKINPFLKDTKCKVIYNMIDHEYWQNKEWSNVSTVNHNINIVVLARYHWSKNCQGMIQSFNKLDEKEKERLRINWYGEEVDNSKVDSLKLIKKNNLEQYISLNGLTKNAKETMMKSNVVALFSFYEGLPNAVIEGMSLNKVILTSNFPDAKRIISDQNLIFDPENPQSITRSLKYLLSLSDNEIIEIGKINREASEMNFSKNKIIGEYLNLMK